MRTHDENRSPATAPIAAAGVSRFAGLDGLRAIAVLLVMVFHLSPGFVPGGYLGVDVFFVISGFLITALLLREKAATGRIRLSASGGGAPDGCSPRSGCCCSPAAPRPGRSAATCSSASAGSCWAR